jgi:hypothetical protein
MGFVSFVFTQMRNDSFESACDARMCVCVCVRVRVDVPEVDISLCMDPTFFFGVFFLLGFFFFPCHLRSPVASDKHVFRL